MKLKRCKILTGILFLFLIHISSESFGYLKFDQNCILAYQKLWNLELEEANRILVQEKKEAPNNHIISLLQNYSSFLQVFTNDEKDRYSLFKQACTKNLDNIELEENSSGEHSPLFLFSKSMIHLQSALLRAKFQDYWSATFELKKAYSDIQKNKVKFPNFVLNDTYIGLIQSLLGNIPSNLKILLNPLGLKGDLETGMEKMENNLFKIRNSPLGFYYSEASLYYAYLSASLTPNRNSYKDLLAYIEPISNQSLLKTYVSSWISMKKYQNNEAIRWLQSRSTTSSFSNFPILDYLLGVAFLNKLDSQSIPYLMKFIQENKSLNFKQDAFLRLSWNYTLLGREDLAKKYLHLVQNVGLETITEKDKQAVQEVTYGIPNVSILKSRLLFDGGYFTQSLEILNKTDTSSLKSFRERLELTYRKARIYETQENFTEAILFHKLTLQNGYSSIYYFAANSSLHLGHIFQKLNQPEKAKECYEKCLNMEEKEFKGSIDREAQTGLNGLKK